MEQFALNIYWIKQLFLQNDNFKDILKYQTPPPPSTHLLGDFDAQSAGVRKGGRGGEVGGRF